MDTLRIIDLFAGAGGLSLGLAAAGWNVVAAVERDRDAANTYQAAHPKTVLWQQDLAELDLSGYRNQLDLLVGGPPCLAKGTLILTYAGYKRIENVQTGELVLTHLGRWRPVTAVICQGTRNVRILRAGGVPELICTPDHRIYARHQERQWDPSRGKHGAYKRTWTGPDWQPAETLAARTNWLGRVLPPIIEDSHSTDFWWLIGRYLGDGWTTRRLRTGVGNPVKNDQGRTVICCAYDEADSLLVHIEAAGFHATRVNDRTTVKFQICQQDLYQFVKPFGHRAHNKTVPGWVLGLDQDRANALLTGYLSADGNFQSYRKRTADRCQIAEAHRARSTSLSLALGIASLAQRARGISAGVWFHKNNPQNVIEGRLVQQRPYWVIDIPRRNWSAIVDGPRNWTKIRINDTHGTAEVWDIAVEEDQSFVANGAIVHNCQPFSVGGLRYGPQDKRDGLPLFTSALAQTRPRAFLLENVPNLAAGKHRAYFEEMLNQLCQLGYFPAWRVLQAADYGVPQVRQRLFVVGLRVRPFVWPAPTHGPHTGQLWVPAGTVVGSSPAGLPNRSVVTYAKTPSLRPNPYHGHLYNGGGRPIDLGRPAPTLLASMGGNKTPWVDTEDTVPGYHAYLLAGGAPRCGQVPGARRITVVEAAALQTFDTAVRFAGSLSSQYRQIGNAVPPLLARYLGEALAAQLRRH